ncbi:MAG: methyltransferase domain-containing protein [Chloroflexi bacterium]|nr:methyltransferase domain-containing protein [Chloroflexota bacterium]
MGEIFERRLPQAPLAWTGERLTSRTAGQVEVEHLHRYFLARALCRGADVLDIASGEGYGAMLLAQVAKSVIGIDSSVESVVFAQANYARANLRFIHGDARSISLPDHSVDIVVSFETIEHFYEQEQFLREVKRVLRPGGRFVVSSPERDVYSPAGGPVNPHHVRELTRGELTRLLQATFASVTLYAQRVLVGSALMPESMSTYGQPLITFERRDATHFEASEGLPRPVYLLAVASDAPLEHLGGSLYIERSDLDQVLTPRPDELNRDAALTEQRNAELTDRVRQLDDQVAELRAELERSITYNQALLSSMSWRVTEPLRRIVPEGPASGSTAMGRLLNLVQEKAVRQSRAPWSFVGQLADVVRDLLPEDARVLVASGGDQRLVQLNGAHYQHFPQAATGAYAGREPVDGTAAIAHLEYLRAKGASYFLLPGSGHWWLERYPAFRRHLCSRYDLLLDQPELGLLARLRPVSAGGQSALRTFQRIVSELEATRDEPVAVLDWGTNRDLAETFRQLAVFSPPDQAVTLPYLDHTIDVVAVREPDELTLAEGRRVARSAVVTFRDRPPVPDANVQVEWVGQSPARGVPTPSIILVPSQDAVTAHAQLSATCELLPSDFGGEVLVAAGGVSDGTRDALSRSFPANGSYVRILPLDWYAAARQVARHDVLVSLDAAILPVDGWLVGLLRTLSRQTDAAVVSGRVLSWNGRLAEAGGVRYADGTRRVWGAGHLRPDDPEYACVREIDWCPASLFATWRRTFAERDFTDIADYCLRLRRAGWRVYYQPETLAVRLDGAAPLATTSNRLTGSRQTGRTTFRGRHWS